MSSPMKLTSSASFSPSIRISLRLKIHQAQAKNFCRVLDIRVTKIMETDLPHTILLQDQREMLCDISGLHKLTDFIDIDIISKLPAIRFSAQLSVQFLFCFQAMQQFLKWRHKRQTAIAGLCLCSVLLNDLALAVYCRLRNGVPNRNGLFLEVDVAL